MVPHVIQKWPEKPIRCMNMLHTTAVSLRRQSTVEGRRSVAMLEPLMLHGLLSKSSSPIHCVQKAKIFSCMSNADNGDMSMDILASSKRRSRRKTPGLKGEEKVSDRNSQKPSRNVNLADFCTKNWPNFAHQSVRFAVAKTTFFKQSAFCEHGSRSSG